MFFIELIIRLFNSVGQFFDCMLCLTLLMGTSWLLSYSTLFLFGTIAISSTSLGYSLASKWYLFYPLFLAYSFNLSELILQTEL